MTGSDRGNAAFKRCLHVEASPRGEHSTSSAAADAFFEALQTQQHPVEVDRLDLWASDLPEFTGAAIAAKYARLGGRPMTQEEDHAWQEIGKLVDRLRCADAVVVSTPMWNFGIPYKLKHWIDLVTQPGLSFAFDPETGYTPLLRSRPTLVILSSAGDYAAGPSRGRPDLATPYLKEAFRFIGLGDVTIARIGPTAGPPDQVSKAHLAAHRHLAEAAATFMGDAR
jgi:FMN-dependent NADH-azoreductase